MLNTQIFLKHRTLEQLCFKYDITANVNKELGLVILNYDHLNKTYKYAPIVAECRGLTLRLEDCGIAAKAFNRFFNVGESVKHDNRFNWEKFVCYEKIDGSLIFLYYHNGTWRINTRNSFANWIVEGFNGTWSDLFFSTIKQENLVFLRKNHTYVFELCSPYTQVVKWFEKPVSYLLSAFNNETGLEVDHERLFKTSFWLDVDMPSTLEVSDLAQLSVKAAEMFEGCVIRDDKNNRLKFKNEDYQNKHKLKGNNNIFLLKYLVPLALSEGLDESVALFPQLKEKAEKVNVEIDQIRNTLKTEWARVKDIPVQKDFAMKVKGHELSSLMFMARKLNKHPIELLPERTELITKIIEGKLNEVST